MTLIGLLLLVVVLLVIAWLVPADPAVRRVLNAAAILLLIVLVAWVLAVTVPGLARAHVGALGHG